MKNILIVDDNKTNLVAAKAALSDEYKITAVTSGIQALKYFEKNTADLILLDINMPEMDGYQTMEKLREMDNGRDIPVVFLTADNDSATETSCLEMGALDFIAKPFVPAVMRSRVSRILEIEELRKNLADRLDQKIQEVSEMKSKSLTDALTGLWNRVYTSDAVNNRMAEGGKGGLFMIDMDNFKAINDNYGHIAGDGVLKMFADTMRKFGAENDILCRIGGDEFVMFIDGINSKSELSNIAADIIADLVKKIEDLNYNTNSSVSIGIAQMPEDGREFDKAYNCADKALYYVKQNGKNSYHFFGEQKEQDAKRSSNVVDLKYLKELMARSDADNGSYLLDFDSFHHVYNFIRRFVERNNREVQTVLFTVEAIENEDITETEKALEILERAVFHSLRRVDVSTRYSSRQLLVILMDTNADNGRLVADRIMTVFNNLYLAGKVHVSYGIAEIEQKPLRGKN